MERNAGLISGESRSVKYYNLARHINTEDCGWTLNRSTRAGNKMNRINERTHFPSPSFSCFLPPEFTRQDGDIYYRQVPWSWLRTNSGSGCHPVGEGCAAHSQCPYRSYCFSALFAWNFRGWEVKLTNENLGNAHSKEPLHDVFAFVFFLGGSSLKIPM